MLIKLHLMGLGRLIKTHLIWLLANEELCPSHSLKAYILTQTKLTTLHVYDPPRFRCFPGETVECRVVENLGEVRKRRRMIPSRARILHTHTLHAKRLEVELRQSYNQTERGALVHRMAGIAEMPRVVRQTVTSAGYHYSSTAPSHPAFTTLYFPRSWEELLPDRQTPLAV